MKNNQTKNKYNRIAKFYNFFTGKENKDKISPWTRKILDNIEGSRVLEVGVGTGKVAVHYPSYLDVVGIDFSENMLERAKSILADHHNIKLYEMDGQNMDFADNSFDTVVAACVFCAVPDPIKGIKEMKRVCKPGGKIIMLEHVRSEKKVLGKIMDILNKLTVAVAGEYINRDTENNVLLAGFVREDVKSEYLYKDIVMFLTIRNNKWED